MPHQRWRQGQVPRASSIDHLWRRVIGGQKGFGPLITVPCLAPTTAISLCDGPAAPAGTTSLSSDAVPCPRAGSVHTLRRHQPVRRARSTGRRGMSCERRGAVPSGRMGSPGGLPSACATGGQHQQAQRLCRAMRLHAIAPDGFHCRAAISLRDGPAAPVGLTSLLSEAVPRHRDVSACGKGQQRQQSLHLWRQG